MPTGILLSSALVINFERGKVFNKLVFAAEQVDELVTVLIVVVLRPTVNFKILFMIFATATVHFAIEAPVTVESQSGSAAADLAVPESESETVEGMALAGSAEPTSVPTCDEVRPEVDETAELVKFVACVGVGSEITPVSMLD